jgi:hypothetical protein
MQAFTVSAAAACVVSIVGPYSAPSKPAAYPSTPSTASAVRPSSPQGTSMPCRRRIRPMERRNIRRI